MLLYLAVFPAMMVMKPTTEDVLWFVVGTLIFYGILVSLSFFMKANNAVPDHWNVVMPHIEETFAEYQKQIEKGRPENSK